MIFQCIMYFFYIITVDVSIHLASQPGKQTFGEDMDTITVPEGATVTLTCTISCLIFKPYIVWRREPYSRLYSSLSGSRLLITSDVLHEKVTFTEGKKTVSAPQSKKYLLCFINAYATFSLCSTDLT